MKVDNDVAGAIDFFKNGMIRFFWPNIKQGQLVLY